MPTPEEQARQEIDRKLEACGWLVQDYKSMRITAGPGVAVREFPLKTGYADYLLLLDCKRVGVIEAKKESVLLSSVAEQTSHYAVSLSVFFKVERDELPYRWCRKPNE